jgi:hypothetical protein
MTEEEQPLTINNISKEQLETLFNHFLQKTRKTTNTPAPKQIPRKPVHKVEENFMEHIDDYFKKHNNQQTRRKK